MKTLVQLLMNRSRHALRDERGAALVTALVLTVAMLTLTVALMSTGGDEVQIAQNHYRATQAQLLAEAGLEAAYTKLRTNSALVVTAPASKTALALDAPGTTLAAAGSYTVEYQRGPDARTVMVLATGTGATGGQRTLRATMTTNFSPDTAILVDGKLKIHADVQITGDCGNVHSNGDVDVDLGGKGKIDGKVTGSGKQFKIHNDLKDGKIGVGSAGNKPKREIPAINPGDFLNQALADVAAGAMPASELFQFMADGRVLDGSNTLLATLKDGGKYNNFKYKKGDKDKPAKWEIDAKEVNPPDGTYYFNGDIKIDGDFKKATGPWMTTILADQTIEMKGKPQIAYHLKDTLLVAGGDLSLSLDKEAIVGKLIDPEDGDEGIEATGLVAAHEQIRLGGTTTINGYIVAENYSGKHDDATLDKEVHIHGKTKINYSCGGLRSPLTTSLRMGTWGL